MVQTNRRELMSTARALAPRVVCMMLGYLAIALGIAASTASLTGTSPFSCIPAFAYALAQAHGLEALSLTLLVSLFNLVCFAAEWALLGRRASRWLWLQVPAMLVATLPIDPALALFQALPTSNYAVCLALLAFSVVVTALGVHLELKARLVLLPCEGLMDALCQRTGVAFGRVKIACDVTFMLVGAVLSLVFLGGLFGVREGSLIAAVSTGACVTFWDRALAGLEARVGTLVRPRRVRHTPLPQEL
jgi:hypothetical protein